MKITHRDDLQRGGFAGLKETRIVMDPRAFGPHANPSTASGIGSFIYLADAEFDPLGETTLHGHKEVDVISVMVDGNISHQGSLEHGQGLSAGEVQVQRAGGEGFSHNEINPDNRKNRMIQLWIAPENAGEPAGYKKYQPQQGLVTRVYGGSRQQAETFDSHTLMDVAMIGAEESVEIKGAFQAYLTQGQGIANGASIKDGDFIQGEDLSFTATEKVQLIILHLAA